MSRFYDCTGEAGAQRADGIHDAASAVRRGEVVVLPTDTVYGIGVDAFSPDAVNALLNAKGRGRDAPPPVLVGSVRAAQALVEDLGEQGRSLIDAFWPGPLTVVCGARPSLSWDLGDTKGTVAVRMPMHPLALELLREVGPMAVSSANRTAQTPALTAEQARQQLGESVAVYLEGGECAEATPSTIVDLTYRVPRILRLGAISVERIRAVCGTVLDPAEPGADTGGSEGGADPAEEHTTESATGPDPQGDSTATGEGSSGRPG
ncbi:L-threonylcarbamoyladenylate synthase [Lipingzhangella sp. LS1_29]|uniref:L-threonylcarbamoyladenylate synthase n=1 Tax=Lipingzhangella rawalii TaxID=2055835 RepID=A0ABU2H578_9ACTN|nr:L-threonylcarbamoyladenylate synthase [Lipingzhangella rawalii]MDS1270461.1 L-threonylcarbamoyladenylate synthase [Lipingzhangella rawalii]